MILTDEQFFATYKDRQARIRFPDPYNELEQQFRSLGSHPRHRRRILLYRVPLDNPFYDAAKPQLLKIPFLAFADETIEDTDDVLLPILRTMMAEQLECAGSA